MGVPGEGRGATKVQGRGGGGGVEGGLLLAVGYVGIKNESMAAAAARGAEARP